MPVFNVQKGYEKRSELKLTDGEMIIGRDSTCGLSIDSGDVSRKHSRVTMKDGHAFIEDLNSSNGTFVNSAPIQGKVELKHMDIVQIGGTVFTFSSDDIASEDDQTISIPRGDLKKTTQYYTFEFMTVIIKKIEENVKKVFKGRPEIVRDIILCLISDGHLLIEDLPGLGKSILAQALAKSIQGKYKRIQFTPDMLPSDITGVNMYNEKKSDFMFMPGPVFGNIILADEINRTTPRTQASLLECMSESIITIDGIPHVLPKPFFVVATQNPSDFHGTYPLPEPQLDRFLMKISIGYPERHFEKEILDTQVQKHPLNDISYVVKATEILQCSSLVRKILVSDPIKEYILNIAGATRKHPALASGASPRASLALMRASQSLAAYYSRHYVIPRDVRELAESVLSHRISLKMRSQGQWRTTSDVIKDIIKNIPIPEEEKKL